MSKVPRQMVYETCLYKSKASKNRIITKEIECDRYVPLYKTIFYGLALPFQPVFIYPHKFTVMIKRTNKDSEIV